MSDTPVKVSMSADLDVIPANPDSPIAKIGLEETGYGGGRSFKGEAKAMGIQSTEDDLNLLVALDEPEQVARALFKVATQLSSNPRWSAIAEAMARANEVLEELNKPSR